MAGGGCAAAAMTQGRPGPTASRVLILAPHPDDEIVACGIAAMRARAAGSRVFVLYLTTGVPDPAPFWPWRRHYAAAVQRRRAEAVEAAAVLGLETAAFRTAPARRLRFDLDRAADDVVTEVNRCRADAIWVCAFEGAHQDHDAANALAAMSSGARPVWEFAAYNFAGRRVRSNRFADPRGGEGTIDGTAEEIRRKQAALARYRSERGNLGHVGASSEEFRPLQSRDYGAPPHSGRLFRERFHWVPFRHPRVDFDPSRDVYRDIAAWASARQANRTPVFGDGPSDEAGEADRQFADPLDEPERQRGFQR
jgi:LmbE family N-acetylglucosaminyl deacetylase